MSRESSSSSSSSSSLLSLSLSHVVVGMCLSAGAGAAAATWFHSSLSSKKKSSASAAADSADPETDFMVGHGLVWSSIGGAMNAAMLYTGDRLGLYAVLREACNQDQKGKSSSGSSTAAAIASVTAVELAQRTGLNQRWLREWLANQAAMGVLKLLPGDGNNDEDLHYRLPAATAEVLANPESKEYDIAMIQMVPTLVNRAKTMLPEAFSTGIGRPYDDPEISEAIDRQHRKHIRDTFIPTLLPSVPQALAMLQKGCQVADLGCGAGVMLILLARAFPNSTFHGYEVSVQALAKAAHNVAAAKVTNIFLHDANQPGESLGDQKGFFDLCIVFDVLHDCTNPADLIQQVRVSLKPQTGLWLLADIPSAPSVRENLKDVPNPATYFAFSTCLCMSCSLSEKGGAGLGTLGFSIPVARKMLTEGGFANIDVLLEKDNARWFLVS